MDRSSYLSELDRALSGLSDFDRRNALAYYNEYLADAEAEGQCDAAAVLGSPASLAAQIRADVAMGEGGAAFSAATDTGWTTPVAGVATATAGASAGAGGAGTGASAAWTAEPGWTASGTPASSPPPQSAKKPLGLNTVWIIILAILAIPLGIPLAATLIGLIVTVLALLFALFVTFVALVVSFAAVGLVAGVSGISLLFVNPPVGLFYLGGGLALCGLAILAAMAFLQLGRLCVRGVAWLFNSIRKKLTKRERGAR
ncbi:MAG: DUF1700 domain-containing protein [Coriobacteriales bacterium]|jgi:uncharacterized membrane protein|nr:DUF1700 domain-containing protein [Coriobacteriales bacterium]